MDFLTTQSRQLDKPSSAQYAAIGRWFWRCVLSGYFRAWNRSQMAADLVAIREFAAGQSEEIRVSAGIPRSDRPANIIMLSSVSNIAISDQRPSAYLRDTVDFDGEGAVRARLESCLINEASLPETRLDIVDLMRAATWTPDFDLAGVGSRPGENW